MVQVSEKHAFLIIITEKCVIFAHVLCVFIGINAPVSIKQIIKPASDGENLLLRFYYG